MKLRKGVEALRQAGVPILSIERKHRQHPQRPYVTIQTSLKGYQDNPAYDNTISIDYFPHLNEVKPRNLWIARNSAMVFLGDTCVHSTHPLIALNAALTGKATWK